MKSRVIIFLILITVSIVTFSQVADHSQKSKNESTMLTELKDPKVIIKKKLRTLEVYDDGRLIKSFKVVLGFAPAGDKEIEGDGKTPEGEFYVFIKNPESRFHLSLGLSYPSSDDAKRGFANGLISKIERDQIATAIENGKMPPQKTALGGEIYIHGGGVDSDWTNGCIALKNEDIEELFSSVPVGTKVIILP